MNGLGCTLLVMLVTVWPAVVAAQNTRPAIADEPGAAEARQRTTTAKRPESFTAPPAEARGIWLASRDMVLPREELSAKLDQLQAANFNAVLIDTQYRGFVAYPDSAFLPQAPGPDGDVLGWLIDECHRRGMQAHLWMEYGFYAYFTPDATADPSMGKILDDHPDLLSVSAEGARFIHRSFGDFYSICPSNPKSHQILANVFVEAVRKYPAAAGVNLDRLRFAGGDYCYCDYCREHFHTDTGIQLRPFVEGTIEQRAFLDWKRQQSVRGARTIVSALRDARPGIIITSYVVGPDEMDDKAQAWDLWMREDLLDAIAVSMYGADIRPALTRAIELLGPRADKLVAAISCDQQTDVYLTNIQLSRDAGAIGQYTWHFGDVFDDLDALRAGPYAKPADPLPRAR